MNRETHRSSYAKMGLAFAVGVALSASYVAIGAIGASAPAVVVVEERCDQPSPTPAVDPSNHAGAGELPPAGATLPAYGLDQDQLEALARHCEVRDDVPEALDDAAAALGLSADEREAYELALARVTGAQAAKEFAFLNELAPDEAHPVDDPVAFRLALRQRANASKSSADQSVHRQLAEERAGLRSSPTDEMLEHFSVWSRFERFRLSHGDRFAAELGEVLDPARVDALRRVQQGWPGRRVRVSGCEDVPMPTVDAEQFSSTGELDPTLIQRIIAAHGSEIRACYELALADDPEAAGTLTVEFTITGSGKVGEAEADEDSSLDHALTHRCAEQAVARWMFPKPRGGGDVTVRHPFELRPS